MERPCVENYASAFSTLVNLERHFAKFIYIKPRYKICAGAISGTMHNV